MDRYLHYKQFIISFIKISLWANTIHEYIKNTVQEYKLLESVRDKY